MKAFLELGYIYQQKNDPLAITYYQNALAVDPENEEISYNLALTFQQLGNYEQALEEYKRMLTFAPQNKYALHNIGYIYLVFEQKFDEAVAFFTKAIEVDPEFVHAICNRGVAFEELGQYENAAQDFQYALKLQEHFQPAVEGLKRVEKLRK